MVIITGALWETAAYAFRILSAKNPTHKASYDASFLLVLLAPICINAFDYMITSRILKTFLPQEHVLGLKGSILGKLFVCLDIMFVSLPPLCTTLLYRQASVTNIHATDPSLSRSVAVSFLSPKRPPQRAAAFTS